MGGFHDVVDAALTAGCKVLAVPRSIEIARCRAEAGVAPRPTVVELTAPNAARRAVIVKRFVDLVGASVALVLASPIMLLVAVVVKIDSRGPSSSGRTGLGGVGACSNLQFRTMMAGAEERREELQERSIYADRPAL